MAEQIKTKKNHKKTWIGVYLVLLIVLYVVIYAFPKVTGALTPTMVLTYDELKVWEDVTCYLVRDEKVYTAEKGGAVNYYAKEGTMVRKGNKILDVNPTSGGAIKSYFCEKNGLVSFYVDGNEGYFSTATMTSLDEKAVQERVETSKNVALGSVLAGEPLYKLVDQSVWYAICWVDQSGIAKFKKDEDIVLELPLGSIEGKIADIADKNGKWLVVLQFDRYYEDMPKVRQVDATVITQDYSGLLVPNESLVTVDGKVGVYVKKIGGEYEFERVKVITTDGTSSLVRDSYFYEETDQGNIRVDTVKIYDEILKSGKP